MTDNEPLFEVGDFVRNKIHGYIAVVIKLWNEPFYRYFYGTLDLVVSCPQELKAEGDIRFEVFSEIEKVLPTIALIDNAKKYLELKNSQLLVDNLLYIEILNNLNEQEKALKLSK